MTSLPAVLYAIPVERFFPLAHAQLFNLAFLIVVASWRVGLLAYYMKVHVKLRVFEVLVATMLPLTAIVTALTILNLERAAFNSMGGFRGTPTPHDEAYDFLTILTFFSVLLFVPLLVGYIVLVALESDRRDKE